MGDPAADDLYARVLGGSSAREVFATLAALEGNAAPPGDAPLPAPLRAWLEETARLPRWLGAGRVLDGQKLAARFGPQVIVALACAALPTCYAGAHGASVLALGQRMQGHARRRLFETADFVLAVMEPGAFEPQGHAVRAAQRVRLMHAALRHHIGRHVDYDPRWGVPINQEDLAGTLLTFSVVVTGALAKLGAALDPADEEAYFHAWMGVGHLLGIDARLLPEDVADGRALLAATARRQFRPSEAGRRLTVALLDVLRDLLPSALSALPGAVMRELLGDEVSTMLAVPSGSWASALMLPVRIATRLGDRVYDRSSSLAELSAMVGRRLLRRLHERGLEGDRPSYRVPTTLSSHFRIPAHEDDSDGDH